jgi:hypothetical protein
MPHVKAARDGDAVPCYMIYGARRKKRKMSPYWEEGVRKSALYLLKLDPETNKLVFVTTLSFVSLFYFRLASMISFV